MSNTSSVATQIASSALNQATQSVITSCAASQNNIVETNSGNIIIGGSGNYTLTDNCGSINQTADSKGVNCSTVAKQQSSFQTIMEDNILSQVSQQAEGWLAPKNKSDIKNAVSKLVSNIYDSNNYQKCIVSQFNAYISNSNNIVIAHDGDINAQASCKDIAQTTTADAVTCMLNVSSINSAMNDLETAISTALSQSSSSLLATVADDVAATFVASAGSSGKVAGLLCIILIVAVVIAAVVGMYILFKPRAAKVDQNTAQPPAGYEEDQQIQALLANPASYIDRVVTAATA